eukprot:scaffold100_cov357-Prasinococcus_capsulatus_cf.AAC.19
MALRQGPSASSTTCSSRSSSSHHSKGSLALPSWCSPTDSSSSPSASPGGDARSTSTPGLAAPSKGPPAAVGAREASPRKLLTEASRPRAVTSAPEKWRCMSCWRWSCSTRARKLW